MADELHVNKFIHELFGDIKNLNIEEFLSYDMVELLRNYRGELDTNFINTINLIKETPHFQKKIREDFDIAIHLILEENFSDEEILNFFEMMKIDKKNLKKLILKSISFGLQIAEIINPTVKDITENIKHFH